VHLLLLHPTLDVSDATERMLATTRAALEAGAKVSVLTQLGPRVAALAETGAEVYSAELPTEALRGFFAERRTSALVDELDPDLLHATCDELAGLTTRIAERSSTPYVLEAMRPVATSCLSTTRWLRAVVVPCETFVEGAVNRGGASREYVEVLPHGPSLERAWTPRTLGEVERPVLATLGTLDDLHGTEVFLEAARRLEQTKRRLRYLVLGQGPREEHLRRRAREHGLSEVLTIASPSSPELGELLGEVDLHASCISAGSPGWSAVQALGLGIPSIFSAVSCTFALVEDRKNGLLVERNRPDKLAEQVEVLLDNPHAARRMGAVARQSMRQREVAAPYAKGVVELHARALGSISV
jgi:glycosyltransferase involved in cell wall biosynthesis